MAVLNVPSTAYPTIQSAVDAAAAGDTIRVAAGTYAESVTIGAGKDRLNIAGAGRCRSILQGAQGLVVGIDVAASSQVSIGGFTVQSYPGTGVAVSTERNVIHRVTSVDNGAAGFSVSGSGNLLLDDEAEGNLTDGFQLTGGGNYLLRCAAERNRVYGVFVAGAANLLFQNCIRDSGGDGVNVAVMPPWPDEDRAVGDAFGSDGSSGDGAVGDSSCSDGSSGDGAVGSDGAFGSTLACNEILYNGGSGVDLAFAPGHTVFENVCRANGTSGATPVGDGIAVATSLNVVDRNDVTCSAASGILVAVAAAGNAIRQNCLLDNRPDITVLAPAGTNVLDLNTCRTSVPAGLCTPPDC